MTTDGDRLVALETRFESFEKALVLQAKEYERRLSNLNHEYERTQAVAHTYLTIEKYEVNQGAERRATTATRERDDERFDRALSRVVSLENWRNRAIGAAVILTVFAGVIGGAIVKAFGG